ncbi:MAG: type II toxin-antitoxin system VapC family toxin [Euryarchaeota archaeon]|nr:type II toxin-antitoxin system VapC family toxin [Euryarchaeota archaeon]MDE1837935.1 type II toxin-antitoxin system VapC family toxin [Euryarchaeota archaeon]MDE1880179.1 type II toxin-antitoxin system VapC family toxin [Euryarchaeota archaeon]MDE2045396.1 type II toxin-antitoxin system VapC family toxin [Thermoplasmata archaeon]
MIFCDTSAWVALADPREQWHRELLRFSRRILAGEFGRVLTTDYVLDETYTLLRMKVGLDAVHRLREQLRTSRNYEVVKVSDDHFERALDLMLAHQDRRWSLTDCTSFLVMRDLGISDALTLDRNFAQAGLNGLPHLAGAAGVR